jgi:DNA repair protein RadD
MQLRQYQIDAVTSGMRYIKDEKDFTKRFIVAPTGSGKSWIIAGIAHLVKSPILILQPNKELLIQNFEKYQKLGNEASIFSASLKEKEIGHVTFATIGSIKDIAYKFKDLGIELILIDECHMGGKSNSMLNKFIKQLGKVKVIGLTATPVVLTNTLYSGSVLKMLNRTKHSFFTKPLHVTQISEVVQKGFWSKLVYEAEEFDNNRLRYNTNGSEFTDFSIENAYNENLIEVKLIRHLNNLGNRKGIIVFCPSIAKAKALSGMFTTSKVVYSGMDQKERDDIISKFKLGNIKIVFNVNILSVGFDYPELDTVIDTVPTASIAKYYQKIGRVTRPHPDKKEALIIDLSGNYERFGDIRDITFEDDPKYGWAMFNKNRLLSGVSLNADPVYKVENYVKPVVVKGEYTFKFGKHQGKSLSQVPKSYLEWMLKDFKWTAFNNDLKTKIENYLNDSREPL